MYRSVFVLGAAGVAFAKHRGILCDCRRSRRRSLYFWGSLVALPLQQEENRVAEESKKRENPQHTYLEEHAAAGRKAASQPSRSRWFEQHREVEWKSLTFGTHFGAAVDARDRIFVWGSLEREVVDDGTSTEDEERKHVGKVRPDDATSLTLSCPKSHEDREWVEPFELDSDLSEDVEVQCSCDSYFVFERRTGKVVVFDAEQLLKDRMRGESRFRGRPVEGLPSKGWLYGDKVREVAVGDWHAAFVTEQGDLYCMGDNTFGQCGASPKSTREFYKATKVSFLPPYSNTKVCKVACGAAHTAVVDVEGIPFTFGDDRRIQLALGDTRSSYGAIAGCTWYDRVMNAKPGPNDALVVYERDEPHRQTSPVRTIPPVLPNESKGVTQGATLLQCGRATTLFAFSTSPLWLDTSAERNSVFCAGENSFGQCGGIIGNPQQSLSPVRLPPDIFVEELRCGSDHCLALLRGGRLFGWGANVYGQVGSARSSMIIRPSEIRLYRKAKRPIRQRGFMPRPRGHLWQTYYIAKGRVVEALKRSLGWNKEEDENREGEEGSLEVVATLPTPLPEWVAGHERIEAVACGFNSSGIVCSVDDDSM